MTITKPSTVLPRLIPGNRNRSIIKTFQSALIVTGLCKMKRIIVIPQATIFQESYVTRKGSSSCCN